MRGNILLNQKTNYQKKKEQAKHFGLIIPACLAGASIMAEWLVGGVFQTFDQVHLLVPSALVGLWFVPLIRWYLAGKKLRMARRQSARLPKPEAPPSLTALPDFLPTFKTHACQKRTAPTIILGIGGTGRWVLTYLKKAITETNFGSVPPTVRLLLIDTSDAEVKGERALSVNDSGVTLEEDEILILHNEGDFSGDFLKTLREAPNQLDPGILAWWPKELFSTLCDQDLLLATNTNQRRPLGRLGLFLDLRQGTQKSRVFRALSNALTALSTECPNQAPKLFVVASDCGGTGSAIMNDMAHIGKRTSRHLGIPALTTHALTASAQCFAALSDSLSLTRANSFATLRELDRMLTNPSKATPVQYQREPASCLDGQWEMPLWDNLTLFDGDRPDFPISHLPPHLAVFPAMADILHSLLYTQPGGAFDHHQQQQRINHQIEREAQGHGILGSMGCFSMRLPIYQFWRQFRVRFAREFLAYYFQIEATREGGWGFIPLENGDEVIVQKHVYDFMTTEQDNTLGELLKAVRQSEPMLFTAIIEADRADKRTTDYIETHSLNFQWYLSDFLMNRLNNSSSQIKEGKGAPHFRDIYYSLNHILDALTGTRDRVLLSCQDQRQRVFHDIGADLLEAFMRIVKNVQVQLTRYIEPIIGPPHQLQEERQRPLIAELTAREEEIKNERHLESQIVVREYLYSNELEETLYQDYLGIKACEENLHRLVWHISTEERLPLVRLTWVTDARHKLTARMEEVQGHVDALTHMADILTNQMRRLDITPYLSIQRPDPANLAKRLIQRASPMIGFDTSKAPRANRKIYLNLNESDYSKALARFLRPAVSHQHHLNLCSFRDPHVFTTIMTVDALPINALTLYSRVQSDYQQLPIDIKHGLHVLQEEKTALSLEIKLEKEKSKSFIFGPKFVTFLRHPEQLRTFATCYLVDWLAITDYEHEKFIEISLPSNQDTNIDDSFNYNDKPEEHFSLYSTDQSIESEAPPLLSALERFMTGIDLQGNTIPTNYIRNAIATLVKSNSLPTPDTRQQKIQQLAVHNERSHPFLIQFIIYLQMVNQELSRTGRYSETLL